MAEITPKDSGGGKGGGKVRSKKSSTKIDMTPMVDLAFLLLTFFMLTTTFSKPQTMEINMPVKPTKEEEQMALKESKALTLILGENDKIYYYQGITDPEVKQTDFSDQGIRKVLLRLNKEVPGLVVLIKPDKTSKYKNVVDILDEMNITNTTKYAIVDITDEDLALVESQITQ